METQSDLIKLIKTIKGLSFQFEGHQSKTRGRLLAHIRFHQLTQDRDMTNARFLEKFLTSVSVLEQYGGTLGRDEGGIEDDIAEAGYTMPASDKATQTASDTARDKFLDMAYMISVD
jgi:lipopolysaccharide biosynthesis protein